MMKESGIRRIDEAFSKAEDQGKHALIGFLTCGDPHPKYTPRLVEALIEGGVDIVELGMPFSDPIADGPIIQAADVRALASGTTPDLTLKVAKNLKADVPVVLLSYFNPILRAGVDTFLTEASSSGVCGLVIPDLLNGSIDGEAFSSVSRKQGVATIMMAAPSTERKRLETLAESTEGFLYLVSLLGVTGSRKAQSTMGEDAIRFIREASQVAKKRSKKTAVGFGISRPEHVREVIRAGADGVIVGSSFVNLVASSSDDIDSACSLLTKYARKLKDAT